MGIAVNSMRDGTGALSKRTLRSSTPLINEEWVKYCVLLAHFNGEDDDDYLHFIDSSPLAHRFTNPQGTVRLKAAQRKFGNTSFLCDNNCAVRVDKWGDDLNIDMNDFTIDFWLYPLHTLGSDRDTLLTTRADGEGGSEANYFNICAYSTSALSFVSSTGDAGGGRVDMPSLVITPPDPNQWAHVAWTRKGNMVYAFKDGVLQDSATCDPLASLGNLTKSGYWVGGYDLATSENGYAYLDELRVLNGYAAWTGNFTPPSEPYNVFS